MLQKANRLLLHQLCHHIAEYSAHGVKPLIRMANVAKAGIVKEYLLDDEDGDRLAELGAGLHYPKTERYDLCGQEEINDLGGIIFYQSSNDAQGCQAQILERA